MSALSRPDTQSGPRGVLATLRAGAKPGEPMVTTVERAVLAYRKGDRADKASARVAQIAGVIKAYLVRVTDTTSIAWALALLETPGRTLAADEVDAPAMRAIQADQDLRGMEPQARAVEILTASFRDWSAAEVERVVSD